MAPLEQIIWEAKLKPATPKDTRRPSTTVDETGCIITRGFVVPSRSSSIESLARSSFSSFETPGTPASPVDEAPAEHRGPIGDMCETPVQALKYRSPAALCRPSKSDGNLTTHSRRPALGERRRTCQIDRVASSASHLRRGSSSRWNDDELAEVTCQPDPPVGQYSRLGLLTQAPAPMVALKQNRGHIRRVKSAQVKLDQLNLQDVKPKQRQKAPTSTHKSNKSEEAQETPLKKTSTADAAIASDSKDDFLSDDDERARLARPNYANYAERRARADSSQANQTPAQYPATASEDSLSASPSENAIETDDEDDDIAACKSDRKISARLSLAQIHCTQNALATKIDPGQLTKRRKSPLSVSIAPTSLTKLTAEGHSISRGSTSAGVNTFEPDAFVANRELRPSRTQPRPAKGVLKNTHTIGS